MDAEPTVPEVIPQDIGMTYASHKPPPGSGITPKVPHTFVEPLEHIKRSPKWTFHMILSIILDK